MDVQDQAQVAGNPSLGRSSDDRSRQQAVLREAVLREAVLRKAGMPGQDMSKVIMGIKTLKLEAHELEAVELALRLQPTIASLKDIVARSDAECTVPCPRQRESKKEKISWSKAEETASSEKTSLMDVDRSVVSSNKFVRVPAVIRLTVR
ncbi:Vesicle-associated membrane protein 7B [Fusarium oxysporum f. sp. albedinis]|nr:Vesicle-associated membrane protein 7B [Fusarium oxysporum f. sp. albedinis]